jgi:hypothetical protein
MSFENFALKVHQQYNKLAKASQLFEAGQDGDGIWQVYLSSFPEGTNLLYLTRTEHDCSCCRNFIKNIGRAVNIDETGSISTIWDVKGLEHPYDVVAKALDEYVKSQVIKTVFVSSEPGYGKQSTVQQLADKSVKRWNHFFGSVHGVDKQPDATRGKFNGQRDLLLRGLQKFSLEHLDTVKDLIEDNAIYRGAEFKQKLIDFRKAYVRYWATEDSKKDAVLALLAKTPVSFFKNEVIGTLVEDLADGVELDSAVTRFEAKVAPANYQRPKAVVTAKMVNEAMQTLEKLGLAQSLGRRFATAEEIPLKACVWQANTDDSVMRSKLENMLLASATTTTKTSRAAGRTGIGFDVLVAEWLPLTEKIELALKNSQASQLFSLTAAEDAQAQGLFKWSNSFGWSYNGDMADSVAERVKAAGGSVSAPLRVSLAWSNSDDLDLHCQVAGRLVYYGEKNYLGKQVLDVDMNAWGPKSDTCPVENMAFAQPPEAVYRIKVEQFCRRSSLRPGYEVHIVTPNQHIVVSSDENKTNTLEFTYSDGHVKLVGLGKGLRTDAVSQELWGLQTNTYVPVQRIFSSPNYWDDTTGNLHWFFQLQGCKSPEEARGFYNEFLRPDLLQHKRVLELAGSKTRCSVTDDQVSGLGFSSTKANTVDLRLHTSKGIRDFCVSF